MRSPDMVLTRHVYTKRTTMMPTLDEQGAPSCLLGTAGRETLSTLAQAINMAIPQQTTWPNK